MAGVIGANVVGAGTLVSSRPAVQPAGQWRLCHFQMLVTAMLALCQQAMACPAAAAVAAVAHADHTHARMTRTTSCSQHTPIKTG